MAVTKSFVQFVAVGLFHGCSILSTPFNLALRDTDKSATNPFASL